jgi:mannose/cellobiose epimerase-like protein (N-acyl-D-glucosamine 2-epimerase family)
MRIKSFRKIVLICTAIFAFSIPSCKEAVPDHNQKYLDGEYWRQQGLTQIIPFWQSHVRDTAFGAYFTNLSREGNPLPPWDKYPAMISRQVFGFTSAYLLSGDEKYLETAREGANYLLKYAWDNEYGGWYDLLDQSGNPKVTTKSVPNQLYTNAGLALYYFATKDENVMSHIRESIRIQKTYSFDSVNGGYVQILSRNLSISDSSKSKHSHYGYTSSLLINMMMITRDRDIRNFADEQMQISLRKMRDTSYGWFYGFPNPYNTRWNLTPVKINDKEVISVGAQLTATLSLLRFYEISGNEQYRKNGINISEQLLYSAWDSVKGSWYNSIERIPPFKPQDTTTVSWWIQSYGMFLQLHLYSLTGEKRYLDNYQRMASFWDNYFVDKEYGGVFLNVTPAGQPVEKNKALAWKASYHEMENALLNYLYLTLYVNHKPVTLYFHIRNSTPPSKHFVSIAEDSSVTITNVKINGKQWNSFDAAERSVTLPDSKDLIMKVTLGAKLKK